MPHPNIIVVGASVGGVEALQNLVSAFPPDLAASVFIVLHIAPESPSLMPEILGRAGPLSVVHPRDGESIHNGHIYIAPPDRHLIIELGVVRVIAGPKENRHRPAIDPLFRSAALAYGKRVIGVVLTGSLDDGTAGLISVKQRGGIAIVQDPETAYCGDMPRSALRYLKETDFVLPLKQIGPKLVELTKRTVSGLTAGGNGNLKHDVDSSEVNKAELDSYGHPGAPSPFACPECHGVLWEKQEGDMLHFRCRVGHAYTANHLAAEQNMKIESALWAALRALEENASLTSRLSGRARDRKLDRIADRYSEQAESKKQQAGVLRSLLLEGHSKVEIPLKN